MKKAATANSKDDFRYVFEKAFEGLVIDRMEGNEEIFGKLMGDSEFRKLAVEHLLHKVYGALKKATEAEKDWSSQRLRRSAGASAILRQVTDHFARSFFNWETAF